jgi:hypothetical protein
VGYQQQLKVRRSHGLQLAFAVDQTRVALRLIANCDLRLTPAKKQWVKSGASGAVRDETETLALNWPSEPVSGPAILKVAALRRAKVRRS